MTERGMGMNCVIGIDTGTTHLKAALISADGCIQYLEKINTPLHVRGGRSWYDPQQIYETVKGQIRQLAARAKDRKDLNICGICLTGMAEAGLVLNRHTGCELTEILPWFDKRPEELSKRPEEDLIRRQYRKTGLYNSYKYGIYKYIWLMENRKLDKASSIWLSLSDYIAFRLTGKYVTTAGFAVRIYAYDMIRGSWDRELLERYGLKEENFPSVVKEGEAIGPCVDKELCGILNGRPEAAIGGHDHICALYAIAGEDCTRIVDSCGTAETYLGLVDKAPLTDADYDRGLVLGPYPGGTKWFFMGNIPSSGQSVEWFRKRRHDDRPQEPFLSYEEMEDLLKEIGDKQTGLFYFPFLSGVGTPVYRGDIREQLHWNMKDVSVGVSLKALIEGIQYQGTWIMECAGSRLAEDEMQLWCVGGAAKSGEWMKIKADILGIPVYVPGMEEAALIGAAAVFFYQKKETALWAGTPVESGKDVKIYLPESGKQKIYRTLAEEYRSRAKQICGV